MAKRKPATKKAKRAPAKLMSRAASMKRKARKRRSSVIAKAAGPPRRRSSKVARAAVLAKSAGKRSPATAAKRAAKKATHRKRNAAAKKSARKVLHKWKKPARRKRGNPAQGAKAMFEKFHGKPSTKNRDYQTAVHFHRDLAEVGHLSYLKVILPEGSPMAAVEIRPKGVKVAMSEDGGQIYFVGGDQKLNLAKLGLASQLPKDHIVIGPVFEIEYLTEKSFDGFKPLNYFHGFGEEGGELPTLLYDVQSSLMYLAGGSYRCEPPGIVN